MEASGSKKPEMIVVVGGNRQNAVFLGEILTRNGYNTRFFSDLSLVLDEVRIQQPSLILLEVDLPQADGYALCRQLKSDERTTHIPIIFLSDLGENFNRAEVFASGGKDYIIKPFYPEEVLARVGAHLRFSQVQHRFESDNILPQEKKGEDKRVEAELKAANKKLQQNIAISKQMGKALHESERQLQRVELLARIGHFSFDANGRTFVGSAGFKNIWGFPVDSNPSFDECFQRIHPDDKDYARAEREKAVHESRDFNLEYRVIWPDGAVRHIRSTAEVVNPGKDGMWAHFFGTMMDITGAKETENELKESKARLEEAQRIAQVGSWEWIEKTDTFTWSKVLYIIMGLDPSRSAPQIAEFHKLFDPDSMKKLLPATQKAMQTGEPFEVEMTAVSENGTRKWLLARGEPWFDEKGHIKGLQGTALNITNQKHAEETKAKLEAQLLQSQKMEAIGRLAGGIAHDFNNMLSVILGNSDLAIDKVDAKDPLYNDLMEIKNATVCSAGLTRQLLAFSCQQNAMPKTINLNDQIEAMLKMLQRIIGENIDLKWIPDNNLGLVKIDPTQVDQTFANLCINARDAISGAGKITIETGNFSCSEAYCVENDGFIPGDYVMVAVSDNGKGMSKKTLDNIFEPYFSTKAAGKGTGLGLATVYGIVRQNEGFIHVYSEPCQGTTFKIYFPRHMGKIKADDIESPDSDLRGGSETILLVEDEETVLNLIKKMLESFEYHVLATTSPTQGLAIAGKHSGDIDLLITDVVMPEMNGRELSHHMESIFKGIKTLFISGYTSNVIANHGILEEGVMLLSKPFTKKELAVKVRETITMQKSG